jgi:hypothetical protein
MLTAAPAGMVKFLEQIKAATGVDLTEKLQEIMAMKDETPPAATAGKTAPKPGPQK